MKLYFSQLLANMIYILYDLRYKNVYIVFNYIKPNGTWAYRIVKEEYGKSEVLYKNYEDFK